MRNGKNLFLFDAKIFFHNSACLQTFMNKDAFIHRQIKIMAALKNA